MYFHTDAIGSVRMVTNSAGQEIARYDYLPFGEPWPGSGAQETRRFGGKERDSETAFDYFGGRYFQSQTGRFTTVDPALDGAAAIVDPQRWNRYAYVKNNPLRFVDPDGRDLRLAQGISAADAKFIKKALIEFVRRPDARALFERLAADERTISLQAGTLNDQAKLMMARLTRGKVAVTFAITEVSPGGTDLSVTIDVRAHSPEWTANAGIDTAGVTTVGHEFAHVEDYVTGGALLFVQGDRPTSETGSAAERGKQKYRQKRDISKKRARELVEQELMEPD